MEKHEVFQRILSEGLIPVIRVSSAGEAILVAEAIKDGGCSIIEITMSVPGALDAIAELDRKHGEEILLGAGTVLDPESGRAALLAGAKFIVTPSLNLDLIRLSHRYSAVIVPGAMTPTEVITAWEAGADMVKIFPAAPIGGPGYIKALRGPFPQVLFVPTGGVNIENTPAFIKAGAAAVAVGGELVDKRAVRERNVQVITDMTRMFIHAIREARET